MIIKQENEVLKKLVTISLPTEGIVGTGARMCIFTFFSSMVTDQRTDRRTNGWTKLPLETAVHDTMYDVLKESSEGAMFRKEYH